MSYRTEVAEALRLTLLGVTTAEDRVFTKLDRPLTPKEMPAIVIYTGSTKRGPQDYQREFTPRLMSVSIEAAVSGNEFTALDAATTLADAIEAAIEADPELGYRVNYTEWQETDVDVISTDETTIGVCLLAYEIDVFTPRAPIPDGPPITKVFADPHPVVRPDYPLEGDPDTACGPDGCDIPAWGGEYKE